MKHPLKNLNNITLKSIEIPLISNIICPLNGATSISFTFTSNTYINITVSNGIVAGVYTTAASLMTAINTTLAIVISPYSRLKLNFATTTN